MRFSAGFLFPLLAAAFCAVIPLGRSASAPRPHGASARAVRGGGAAIAPEFYLLRPSSLDRKRPVRLLVLLHGEGEDERAFAERFRGAAERSNLVLLSLRGPRRFPGGGYAWFDPHASSREQALRTFYPGLVLEVRKAARALDVERPSIVIAGFSQGAVAALHAGLQFPGLFAGGVVAFSGKGYGLEHARDAVTRAAALGRRVVLTVGLEDPSEAEEGERIADLLNDRGVSCALHGFGTVHALPPHLEAVLDRILSWLAE